MRLLHTGTVRLSTFQDDIPPHAIISHRQSGDSECTLKDLWPAPRLEAPEYQRIIRICHFAKSEGWNYIWIEGCCLDRTNDAELADAFASAYRWHRNASICYAFMSDVPAVESEPAFAIAGSNYFQCGRTLPALLASREVVFMNANFTIIGTRSNLRHHVAQRTGVKSKHLKGRPLRASVAERMSWAASRSTIRAEDAAYYLMGLFDVQIPLRYGEGFGAAFERLQYQVLKHHHDDSLFAWNDNVRDGLDSRLGLLASSPSAFRGCAPLQPSPIDSDRPRFAPTERGLWGHPLLIPVITSGSKGARQYIMPLNCVNMAFHRHFGAGTQLAVLLEQTGPHTFARVRLIEPVSGLYHEPWDHRNAFREGIRIERPEPSLELVPRNFKPQSAAALNVIHWDLDNLRAQGFVTTFPPTGDTHAACIIAREPSPGSPRERFIVALKRLRDTDGVDMRIHEPHTPLPRTCEPKMGPPLGPNHRETWRTFRTLTSGAWLTVRLVKFTRVNEETYTVKVTYTARPELGARTRHAAPDASMALIPADMRREVGRYGYAYDSPMQKQLLALPAPGDQSVVDFSRRRRSRECQRERERRETSSERRKARAKKAVRIAGLIAMSIALKRVVI